ncbi:MAG: efflux RND transporter permease subunit [Candidatus Omnitrophica bacterium]|nr:efflux RND transporter permease subunit [Candidatus Omnitrophota bacterium]
MTLSDLSIKNPVFAWMMMAALIIFGIISYTRLGVGQLPDVDFPMVSINLTWEGAAPEVMETDVVDIAEDSLMSIQGVREISSSIRQGSATISVEFDLNKNIDVAVQDVQSKIDQAQRTLPKELDPAVVTKVNSEDHPILMLAVSSDGRPLRDIMTYVQDHLKNQFATINGVGDIFLGGFVDRNLRVWVDANKLEAYQLTVQDVIDAVKSEHEELPAGRIETPIKEFNVRVMGEAATTKEFENLLIPKRSGQPVFRPIYLKEVATIEDGLADVRRIARSNKRQTVALGIRKQRGANEVEVAHKIMERLAEIKKYAPKDIDIGIRYNKTKFSEDSIQELIFTLILSAIVTSLVCWFFLGSWSATLNILLAIPTSVLGTFIVIYFLGFTLNTFTVLGLSLAIGIVVDDAIMVLENIVRYRERGVEKVEAARRGARQITFAAIAATIALIAIFLPVAFMYGIIGKFFFQYGVTISVAVALSLLEALTLAPMRCSQFLEVGSRRTFIGKGVDSGFKWLASTYHFLLEKALRARILVVILALAFFAASIFFVGIMRKEFLPSQDMSMLMCRLQTPVGSSITLTDERSKLAEDFLMSRPEVSDYFSLVGGFGSGEVNSSVMFVTLKDPKKRPIVPPNKKPLTQGELMTVFRKELNKIPDTKATIQDLSLSGFSAQRGFPVEFTVRGPDWEKLSAYSDEIRAKMEESKLMLDVDTDFLAKIPEIRVVPNRQKADDMGVSVSAIGSAVNALIGGERIAKYTKDGRRYDVRVRLMPSQRTEEEDIEKLWVWNNRNELVQLKNVVTISSKPTPMTITRRNRERAITIYANVAPGKSQTDAFKEVERITKSVLPEGYKAVFSGSAQTAIESLVSLLIAFILGILIAYMVLASQFNSYLHPLSVLFALPFSISGAFISLWVFNQSLNIYSMIGLILLMGIVKKNSILLVDFTNQHREAGLEVKPALLKACPIRLRPILMTSIATISAAVPPALAIGPGAETRIPMSITIIGGVIVSTLFTLFVVPCVYSLFSKLERRRYDIKFEDLDDKNDSAVAMEGDI